MTVPEIVEHDLATLAKLAPDLSFADQERRAVLLENGSRDINAAPGSGKTTLLAAKLLLLGQKWSDKRSGICVLSHTNVAREEIQQRLSSSITGSTLLAYPHFIGTIHALVNQFLALPFMRSNGLVVDTIDDEVFARRALAIANSNWKLRAYMGKSPGVAPMIEGLVYRGQNLDVASERGALPGASATTLPFILSIKETLTKQGIFRYGDMFAFAEYLLLKSPDLKARMSQRFPLVFIDEMQDTSWEQERLLDMMFDDTVIIQRLGDVNQRILGNVEGAENLTFPKAGALSISTSKRFGPAIARTVASAQLAGPFIVGERPNRHPPMLLTYTTPKVDGVIAAFGVQVLDRFDDAELRAGTVKALCARKQGDAKTVLPGRTLLDYWPGYADANKALGPRIEQFWALVSGASSVLPGAGFSDRSGEIRRAVLMALRASGAETVKDIRDPSQLMRRLIDSGFNVTVIRRLVRDIAIATDLATTEAGRNQVSSMLYEAFWQLLPQGTTLANFAALPIFAEPVLQPVPECERRVCAVEHSGRRLDVQIGSLASMKGETHLATLVLESYGWPGKRFDVAEALPIIAGLSVRDPKLKESHLAQYRNLYVGMSRPTSFLCLSVNAKRVSDECKAGLIGLGWVVRDVA